MGNEILKIEIDNDGWYKGDTIVMGHSYKYDSIGRVIEIYESIFPIANDTLFTTKIICKYNNKGELSETNAYNDHLILDGNSVFNYDCGGNLIVNEFHGHGIFEKESEKTIYRYVNGKVNKIFHYYPSNILNYLTTIKYDNKNMKTETFKDFKYKSNSNVKTTTYDLKGNVVEETKYARAAKVAWSIKYKYQYDAKGNWIKEISSEYKHKPLLSERTIEYYMPSSVSNND